MTLLDIKAKENFRMSFRLALGDLEKFVEVIKNRKIEIKHYFEECLINFNEIEEFKDFSGFRYEYTKEKSYTIVLDGKSLKRLGLITKCYRTDKANVLRYIILKTLNKN